MQRFGYLLDPLFLLGCSAYTVNRWIIKPHLGAGFFHSYFNDLWLIPCALPVVLWLHHKLGLRDNNEPPGLSEIVPHLIFWSVLFEWIGPKIVTHTTSDPVDVLAYTIGAITAGLWWQRARWLGRVSPT